LYPKIDQKCSFGQQTDWRKCCYRKKQSGIGRLRQVAERKISCRSQVCDKQQPEMRRTLLAVGIAVLISMLFAPHRYRWQWGNDHFDWAYHTQTHYFPVFCYERDYFGVLNSAPWDGIFRTNRLPSRARRSRGELAEAKKHTATANDSSLRPMIC
jgi:hypothetical protein